MQHDKPMMPDPASDFDSVLEPEAALALLRRMALTESDCYGCVDWFHFERSLDEDPDQ